MRGAIDSVLVGPVPLWAVMSCAVMSCAVMSCAGSRAPNVATEAPVAEPVRTEADVRVEDDRAPPFGLQPAAVARAVVINASCLSDDAPGRTARSLYFDHRYRRDWLTNLRSGVACLARSTEGCAATERCLGAEVSIVDRCTRGCDGSVGTLCDDSIQYRVDCAERGQVCDPSNGRCKWPPGDGCESEGFVDSCAEGRPVQCLPEGMHHGPACDSFGLRCAVGQGDRAMCIGTSGECSTRYFHGLGFELGDGECRDERTLATCVNGGLHLVDCAEAGAGFACRTVQRGDQPVSFCGLAAECSPIDGGRPGRPGQCEGDQLVLCNVGRIDRVDCRSLGFERCDAAAGRCAPGLFSDLLARRER